MNCLLDFEILFNDTPTGMKVADSLLKVNAEVQKAVILKMHTLWPDEKQYLPLVELYDWI